MNIIYAKKFSFPNESANALQGLNMLAAFSACSDRVYSFLSYAKNFNSHDEFIRTIQASGVEEFGTYTVASNTLRGVRRGASDKVETIRGTRQRRLHKAFLRYHDPDNWPLLREALKQMGRADLIGSRPDQLVPAHQPPGTGKAAGTQRPGHRGQGAGGRMQRFTTKGVPIRK